MATVYIPDEMIFKIIELKRDKQSFVKDAITEKLQRDYNIITG